MQQINMNPRADLSEDLIRHMVLNSLRKYIKQFRKYGTVIIACDSLNGYWRKDIFPFYKAHRKKDREASKFDWKLIFNTINTLKEELKDNFPYKVIEVTGAEADDIIAILVKEYRDEDILILSSDKDFVQLQKYKNVKQYSPILKRFITTPNPHKYIREHIIKGDRGDGVPNFLSSDNVFVIGNRQKPISKTKLEKWVNDPTWPSVQHGVTDNMARGFSRNQQLVDLDFIPENIKQAILEEHENVKPCNRTKMLNYFISKKLKSLIAVIDEF
jgi:hypothetical protein